MELLQLNLETEKRQIMRILIGVAVIEISMKN
jgi:hypothetical protein